MVADAKENMSCSGLWTPCRCAITFLVVVVLAGLLPRCWKLTARSLWYDESFCWGVIQYPWAEMVERVGLDNHPPLYFVLLKTWTSFFGESLWAMRGLSVLLGLLTVVAMYLFVEEASVDANRDSRSGQQSSYGVRAGLIAAAFVASSPFHIRWSQEVRMYALAAFLTALSSWLMFRALHRPRALGRWILFGLSSLCLPYTHYYGLFSCAAQFLFLISLLAIVAWRSHGTISEVTDDGKHSPESIDTRSQPPCDGSSLSVAGILLAGMIVVVGYLPWVPTLLAQRAQVQSDFWTQEMSFWSIPKALNKVFLLVPFGSDRLQAVVTTIGCLVLIALLMRRVKRMEGYLLLAIVVPLAAATLITQCDTKIFVAHYLFAVHLFFVVSAALVIARLSHWEVQLGVVGLLVLLSIDYHVSWRARLNTANRPGGRAAVAFLESERQKGEPVVVCSPLLYYSLLYYATDRDGWYIYDHPHYPITHYGGRPLVEKKIILSHMELKQLLTSRIWVADMRSMWPHGHVPVLPGWKKTRSRRFREPYRIQGTTVIRAYDIGPEHPQPTRDVNRSPVAKGRQCGRGNTARPEGS